MSQSYRIFQSAVGGGQLMVGVEYIRDGVVLDRHNYSFSPDETREGIHRFLETQLHGKIAAMEKAEALAASLAQDLEVERRVAPPVNIGFSPAGGAVNFPISVTLSPSAPIFEIRYTIDGSDPGEASPPYRIPLLLNGATMIKASGYTADGLRGAISQANYTAVIAPGAQPLRKSAVVDLIPQVELAAILANEGAFRVYQSFLVLGPDVIASTQSGVDKARGFCTQYLAAAILSQATYDTIRTHVLSLGWTWA